MDDALRRGEAYRKAGADLLFLSSTRTPEQLRAISERLGGPLMYLTGRGGLAGSGMTLRDLGNLGYKIVADPRTPVAGGVYRLEEGLPGPGRRLRRHDHGENRLGSGRERHAGHDRHRKAARH